MILCIIADCLKKQYIVKYLQLGGKCLTFCNVLVKKRNRDVLEREMLKRNQTLKTISLMHPDPNCLHIIQYDPNVT